MELLLFLSLIIAQYRLEFSFAAPTVENNIANGAEDVKTFRDSYELRMRSYMNTSVDPCDDFYEYACGNYPNVIENIEVANKQNGFYDLEHATYAFIDKILQKERSSNEQYYEELQKVKHFVDICDSAELLPMRASDEYLGVVNVIGGFPAVDPQWNASEFDWFKMAAHLNRYGVAGLTEEEQFVPYFEIAELGFDFIVHSDNIKTNTSLGYVHNASVMRLLLEIYGVDGAKADKVIDGVFEFWREALVWKNKVSDRGTCDELSVEEGLGEEYKFPQWKLLFEISYNLNDSDVLDFVSCPCDWYYKKLDDFAASKPEYVANYMALKFLHTMHPQITSTKYQHRQCIQLAKSAFSMVLTHFYMTEHFSMEEKQEVEKMISEIKVTFTDLVESADWLDESTRKLAVQTVKSINIFVGQRDDPVTDKYIKKMTHLNLSSNFAANNLELAKFKVDMSHYGGLNSKSTLNNDDSLDLEILEAIKANAFYDPFSHSINVLAGMLYPPIYHHNLPISAKYGGLGFIIGHEIGHSLDRRSRVFERDSSDDDKKQGSMKSVQVAKNRTRCYSEQLRNYTLPVIGIKVNTSDTLNEAVADSIGIRGSLYTYRRILKNALENTKDEQKTEFFSELDLDIKPEQSFFLSFTQVLCAKYYPRHYWNEIYEGYPIDKYRAMGSMQNLEDFADVFNCPVNSTMNPKHRCRLW